MEEIIIDIAPNGDVTIEGKGIKGPHCAELTKSLEKALGKVESKRVTAEYHQRPVIKRQVKA